MTLTDTLPRQVDEAEGSSTSSTSPQKSARLISLDALRGFDMLCILGAGELVRDFAQINSNHTLAVVAAQLEHRRWEGFAFEDLIFPLFVFLVGVSLVFSLGKLLQTRGTASAVRRIIIRSIILFLFGILYNTGMGHHYGEIRIMGVLQRIALAYLAAGLMFCFAGPKTMAAVAAGILVVYWVLLAFVPVPGVSPHSYAEGANWPNYVDAHYLPLHKYDGDHDPEGYLSTFPAIVTCLLGVFAGLLLKRESIGPYSRVVCLVLGGAAMAAIGYAWGLEFPIIKKLWTSSYVLVAGGYSAMLLGIFYLVIDAWKLRFWTAPFLWVGMNAITLYMIQRLFGFTGLAERCIGGDFERNVLRQYGPLAVDTLALVFLLALARFLYKRRIFLRV